MFEIVLYEHVVTNIKWLKFRLDQGLISILKLFMVIVGGMPEKTCPHHSVMDTCYCYFQVNPSLLIRAVKRVIWKPCYPIHYQRPWLFRLGKIACRACLKIWCWQPKICPLCPGQTSITWLFILPSYQS